MELDRYLKSLARNWWIPALVALIGMLGVMGYLQWSSGSLFSAPSAVVTVAVTEPAVTRAFSGTQAQVNFASIVESKTVEDRVTRRLNIPSSERVEITVRLERTLVPAVSTPLYRVSVDHPSSQRALLIADAVVEEAQALFIELNSIDSAALDGAFTVLEEQYRGELDHARADLRRFEDDAWAWDLPSRIENQRNLVADLRHTFLISDIQGASVPDTGLPADGLLLRDEFRRLQELRPEYERLSLEVAVAAATISQMESRRAELQIIGGTFSQFAAQQELNLARQRWEDARAELESFKDEHGIGEIASNLSGQAALIAFVEERAELVRLEGLRPRYEELASAAALARDRLNRLELRKVEILTEGVVAPASQVKVLDRAHIQPNIIRAILFYAIGAVAGGLTGLLIVYLIAYFNRTPLAAADAGALVGAPVLATIPRVN